MSNIIRLDKKIEEEKAYLYQSPIGELLLSSNNQYITALEFSKENKKIIYDDEPSVIKKAKKELDSYFSKKLKVFNVPLALYGTDFQYNVWLETYKIAFGQVCTYSDIAKKVSNRLGSIARAVGITESKNPIAIIIPCHRVVSVNKKLTGYAGGLDKKEFLLKHEGFNIVNSKIILG